MDRPQQPLNTFVLRLWQGVEGGLPVWRGEAQHIQTGEHLAFADEVTLLRFLRRWISMSAGAPTAGELSDAEECERPRVA